MFTDSDAPGRRRAGTTVASVRLTLTGSADVLLEVCGPVDDAVADRCARMLGVALRSGARRVIVDLEALAGPLPTSLAELFDRAAAELRDEGGWRLVAGGPPSLDPAEPVLPALFAAYRQVVPVLAVRG